MTNNNTGLYIHIPFCVQKCGYCDFYSCDDKFYYIDDYIEAAIKELKYYKNKYDIEFSTLFIGGGTPTVLTEKQLDSLFTGIYSLYPKKNFKEITIEANPETITDKTAKVLAANVNRVSMGAQSFDDNILKTLGRVHNSVKIKEAFALLRENNINNINLDLMYGIPGQNVSMVISDIEEASSMGAEHISFYMFTPYPETPIGKLIESGGLKLPSDDDITDMFITGAGFLEGNDYKQYEIANFCKDGKECIHNLNYWDSGKYIGIGTAAASYFDGLRYVNLKNIEDYIKQLKKNDDPAETSEKITPDMELKEFIMLKLRTVAGINKADFKERFGYDFDGRFGKIIERPLKGGLLTDNPEVIALTRKGMMVSNTVIALFF